MSLYTEECWNIALDDPRWRASPTTRDCVCGRFHAFRAPDSSATCPACWDWCNDLDAPAFPIHRADRPVKGANVPTLTCPACAKVAFPQLAWNQVKDATRGVTQALAATCAACRAFIAWVDPARWGRYAPEKPVLPAQVVQTALLDTKATAATWVDTSGLTRDGKASKLAAPKFKDEDKSEREILAYSIRQFRESGGSIHPGVNGPVYCRGACIVDPLDLHAIFTSRRADVEAMLRDNNQSHLLERGTSPRNTIGPLPAKRSRWSEKATWFFHRAIEAHMTSSVDPVVYMKIPAKNPFWKFIGPTNIAKNELCTYEMEDAFFRLFGRLAEDHDQETISPLSEEERWWVFCVEAEAWACRGAWITTESTCVQISRSCEKEDTCVTCWDNTSWINPKGEREHPHCALGAPRPKTPLPKMPKGEEMRCKASAWTNESLYAPDDDRARCQLKSGHAFFHMALGFLAKPGATWSGEEQDLHIVWSDKPIRCRRSKRR